MEREFCLRGIGSLRIITHLFSRTGERRRGFAWFRYLALSVFLSACLTGCSRLRPKPAAEYVYVTSKQTYLRDRVAAVSNRTATVENGDKLQVLEKNRRFLHVRTEKGEEGWLDDRAVATQQIYDEFDALKRDHGNDPVVATGVVRDDVYLHTKPGRETDRLFRLLEGDKLKLLRRASVPKPVTPGQQHLARPSTAQKTGTDTAEEGPPPPIMEDWWLVQDSKGRTGWLYGRMMDVDVPDAIMRYSEGQRVVGAYVLTRVNDLEAPQDDKDVPVYVTVLSPYTAGLPYDFNQVRVFVWNLKKHRYETGFRERNIEGYLPVKIGRAKDPYGKAPTSLAEAPTFSYRVLAADAPPVIPDPVTGISVPTKTNLKTYRLEGNLVRRIIAPGTTPPDDAHPEPVAEKKKKSRAVASRGRRRR